MPSEISTNKGLLTSKSNESRWLVILNLPETATEETIKECFERHGRIQSVKIHDQNFAFVAFLDIRTASKAHQAENILDKQQLRTAFYDSSNSIPKILLETSPGTSSIVEPFSSSPSSITTVTNTLIDKTTPSIHEDRDKRTSRTIYSPEENTRHQVVPIKHGSDSSENKRKTSSINNSKTNKMKSTQRKHDKSSSSSERSYDDSLSHKHHRQDISKLKRRSSKTKILKISHLPSKLSTQSLRETLRTIFLDFKKSSHLLNIKIIDGYALLTFERYEDVDKALLFIITKSINGIRLKAEPYNDLINENDEHDLIKRSDLDINEYSVKATRTLYIGNLQSDISYHDLREIYSVYGDIIEIEVKRQQSQHSFAFIQYADIKSVVKAMKSKIIHDHSIKLGFGKSQPTNVLWLDDLPSNITELNLRSFLNCLTNLSSDEILDIYIDNRNSQKNDSVQCLIYFTDIIAAQNAINSIRGKKFQTKRIQVDFASRIFLTKFSDIIQQTNQKKANDRCVINRSDRRYSKVSETGSSIIRQPTRHHSSSSSNHSSINHKKLIKSDTDKHANTSRIFDWLMKNHHSNVNDDDEEHNSEEQLSNIKLIENKNNLKNIFQTKNIPLQTDSLFIQSDIRLKVYSSSYKQSINSICLPLPYFAKNLTKTINNSIIINPKAHLKHLLNNISIKQEPINNEDLFINKEVNERIKLLDKQLEEINRNQNIQTSSLTIPTSTMNSNLSPQLSIPPLLISPVSSNKQISSILSMKFKRKPIPPPLSVIPTLSIPSNTNDSPTFSTPKSAVGNQNHSPELTISSISQKQIVNNSPKPTVLKSILKQPSNLSPSTSNEIRKAVHIISTNSSLESTIKRTLPSNDKEKITNNINKHQIDFKLIKTTKKSLKTIKRPLPTTKVVPSSSKIPQQLNKIPKLNTTHTELNQKSIQSNKSSEQKLTINSDHNNKKILKKKFTLKQNTSMYDRIKERSRSEKIRNKLLLMKDDTQSDEVKQHNVMVKPSESKDDKSIIFSSEIFDTEENDIKKIKQQQQIIKSKFNKNKFILKTKLKTNILPQKRSSIDEPNRSLKKIKITEESLNNTFNENVISPKVENQQSIPMDNKEESTLKIDDIDDPNPISSPITNKVQEDNFNKPLILNELSLQISSNKPDELPEKTLNISNPSDIPIDHQAMILDKSIPTISSDITKPSCIPSSTTKESLNPFDSRSITTHKPPSTSMHPFPQIPTPEHNLFTPHHQHFPYPFFAPPPPDSPPSSTRTLSTSSCGSIIGNPFYNTIIPGQQHCHDKDSRRVSTTSSQYPGSSIDSILSFRNPSELYGYPSTAQQMLNSFATEFHRIHDIQSCDPYDIQWEGYITLKSDQAYIKTQLIAGSSQIARTTINYWNTDLHHYLRISQRMRLEETQLDGVKKHMQMTNDHCIFIAEPNGLTPDEIRFEQNNLKHGVIQYLNEKKAAGIINILLPGVLQPVYVVHIFPPCEFASEILQQRAPDAYRCVVQNKIEQIYLLFIITSTIE